MDTALAIALALVAIAAGVTVAVLAWKLADAEGDRRAAEAARDVALEANASSADHAARLEDVISQQKQAIRDLEADLEACTDPAVVRARLRRLFTPEGGDGSGGGVPS